MKIEVETKYDVGDYVYIERNHEIVKLYIYKVVVLFRKDDDIIISYLLKGKAAYTPLEEVTEEKLERYFRRTPEAAAEMIADNYLHRFKY